MNNLDHIYNNLLPTRHRREDKDLLLKRFLTFTGQTLDTWEGIHDSFDELINPSTSTADWIAFWLQSFFGWSWFPWWFTLADKRRLYGNMGRHLARRGTRPGIELWLRDFGIVARVHTRSQPWGEAVWGESTFSFPDPLDIVVELLFVTGYEPDADTWGECVWGESFWSSPRRPFTDREIADLVRFMQPNAQTITILWALKHEVPIQEPVWGEFAWSEEYWATPPAW